MPSKQPRAKSCTFVQAFKLIFMIPFPLAHLKQYRLNASVMLCLLFLMALSFPLNAQRVQQLDADVYSPSRKNDRFIKRKHILTQLDSISIGNERFYISIFKKAGPQHQKYMVIHDSEDAAFDAGLRAIKRGGTLIALENQEQRALFSYGLDKGSTHQDPNRMFQQDNPYWPVAQQILKLLDFHKGKLIIVLHNNKPGGNFRIDTIASWNNISAPSKNDPHLGSMVWIPGKTKVPDQSTQDEISYYKNHGMNVVYEYVPLDQKGDGSLSVYSSKHGIPYRNIEVEAGIRGKRHSELKARHRQIKYLNVLRKYHGLK
jgi:hypothetical protein